MANIGGPGGVRSSWIARLRDQRPLEDKRKADAGDRMEPKRGAAGFEGRARDDLLAAGVPEKLADEHGPHLAGALGDAAGLAALGGRMEPWRAKQLERALGQIYKVLGLQLTRAPAETRAAIAAGTLAALRALAEEVGPSDHLMPSLFAASGLIDSGVRLEAQKKLVYGPGEAAKVAEQATAAVSALRAGLAGRAGVASALNVYSNIVEQLERTLPAPAQKDRVALWRAASALLVELVPKRGFDQALAAELSDRIARRIAAGGDAQAALAAAREGFGEQMRPRREQALQQVRGLAGAYAAGTPQHQCMSHVVQALENVVAAHPLGPDALFQAVEAFGARAQQYLANVWNQDVYQIWGCGAAIVSRFAAEPGVRELLEYLTTSLLPAVSGRPAAVQALQRAADANQPIANELIQAQIGIWNRTLAHYPGLDQALAQLQALDAGTAVLLAAAVAPHLANQNAAAPLLRHLTGAAKDLRADDPVGALAGFAGRFGALANRLSAWLGQNDKVAEIAARVARSGTGNTYPQPAADQLAQMLRGVQNAMPRVDLLEVATRGADGHAGIAETVDPAIRYRYPPTNFFETLLNLARAHVQHDPARALEVTKLAIELSAKLGNLDGDWQVPFQQRIQQDWNQAIANPARLVYAARAQQGGVAVRAQQGTIPAFLAAHPELPLELAFTAGLHLSPEQLGWTVERIGEARGRDTVRSLRDFLFACITANRKDVIDVVRASKSPAKALSAVIAEVGRDFRGGRLAQVPWNEIVAGLQAGGDPFAEIQKKKIAAGMAGLNLEHLAEGKPDPAGMEMIARCAPAITSCLDYYNEQKPLHPRTDAQIDYAPLIPAFTEVLKSVAQGTWPKVKYENEVGRRLLAILTPEQEEIWRTETVTPLGGAGAGAMRDDPTRGAIQLLKGLAKALPREVKLSPELGVTWDAASRDKLAAERAQLLDALHDAEKGSARHRELGNRLGLINRNAAAIELQLELEARFEGKKADPRALLMELKPPLASAASALRALGARGSWQAVNEALFVARDLKTTPRQGRYAVDEDSLESLIMSHTTASGSCLNYVNGFRRWGLAGSAADANIRMLRTYDGDKFGYRAFLKLFPAKFDGWDGPVLWIDSPMSEGAGTPEDLQNLYRTAIAKAGAMGIPVLGPQANLINEGKAMGLETKALQVSFSVDEGNTGCQHSDFLFGGAGNVRTQRGQNPYWVVARNAQIVMPAHPMKR